MTTPNTNKQSQSQNAQGAAGSMGTTGTTGQSAGGGTRQGTQQDRERPLRSSRESQGTGLSRRQGGTVGQPLFGDISPVTSPFTFMRRMSDEMDRLFSDLGFGRGLWSGTSTAERGTWAPQVDVFQRGNDLVVRADLPGLSKDDLSVNVEDDVLTISGNRKQESEENQEGYYWNERRYGAFQRSIPLPDGIDPEQVNAQFHDGVLEVTLPMPQQEQRRGKQIQIR